MDVVMSAESAWMHFNAAQRGTADRTLSELAQGLEDLAEAVRVLGEENRVIMGSLNRLLS